MMNINDSDIDLRLALGSRNYSVETRLNSNSGAGVNANSRVDMTFAASDPLSELVWSPHNGLSLKCANSSFVEKKPFLTWSVVESIKDTSTSQGIRSKGSGDMKTSDEEKMGLSPTLLDGTDNCGDKATIFWSSRGSSSSDLDAHQKICDGKMEKTGTTDAIQEENYKGKAEEDLCSSPNVRIAESRKRSAEQDTLADGENERKSNMAINWKFPYNLVRGTRFNLNYGLQTHASRSDNMGFAIPLHSEPPTVKASEALACSLPNMQSREELDDDVTSASGDVNKNKTKAPISIPAPTMMRLESSAENDLSHFAANEAHSSGETGLPRENFRCVDEASMDGRICLYQEKEKEKASSNEDIYARSSNDEDNSHESMESCNSTRLFSKGIKRQHFDQALLIGSKRMRKQIQRSHDSTSIVKHDSSFMNWISNMVKGLSDYNKEQPLPLAHSNNDCSGNHQENLFKETTNCTRPNMGFQTVFQSLYLRSTKTSDSGGLKDGQPVAESRELVVADEKSLENFPQLFDGTNDSSFKQLILPDKEVNPQISGSPSRPWILSADRARTPNLSERNLMENKASEIPECKKEKGEVSPSRSSCEKVNSTSEKTSPNFPLPLSYMPEKNSPLSSLWITRLYTRTARLENCNQITEEARDFSSECPKANIDSQANRVLFIDQKTSEARDDFSGDAVNASEQEMLTFSPKTSIQPFQKFRCSEAMASVFAKRLDALRHIIHPSEKRKSTACQLLCFFCGRSGHDLRQCPKLTETELENLLVKISSFHRVEESPCLCIRCFQLDHWAISCPLVSSQENRQSEPDAGHYTSCLQLRSDDKYSSYLGGEDDGHKQVLGSFSNYLTWNVKESSRKRPSASTLFQKSTSSSSEHHLKDEQILPPCNSIDALNAVPEGEIFHAIRKLRLSRADILRWMNSNVPLSRLNGFFLRLRVGKLEGGLEDTSYYVACITGDTIENIDRKSKKSILVDVGGIKSSVGSQYISNHDFLEVEIKAWWSRIVKNGCKTPSLDELNSKLEHRKRLSL